MARISLDTNILFYSLDATDPVKHVRAASLVTAASEQRGALTQQVLGELLNASRKLNEVQRSVVAQTVSELSTAFTVLSTPLKALLDAFDRAVRFRLQFWDAVIVTTCIGNGVTHLLSEDLQDGQQIDGLVVVNPFHPANDRLLDTLMAWEA